MSDSKPTAIEAEIEELRAERDALHRQLEFFRREHQLIGRVGALLFLGPSLVNSLRAWLATTSTANPLPIEKTATLAAAIVRRILSVGFIGLFFASILPAWLLWVQTEKLDLQNSLIKQQNVLAEASRRSTLTFEVSSILDEIDEEMDELGFQLTADYRDGHITASDFSGTNELPPNLEVDQTAVGSQAGTLRAVSDIGSRPRWRDRSAPPKFKVSDRLRGRIAAVSRSLRPYVFLLDNGDTSQVPLSPERGQLLLALVQAGVDMEDLNHSSVTFQRAFLEEIEITGPQASVVDLRHVRLQGAHIKRSDIQADLTYARLDEADLEGTSLGGKLDATFFKANLRSARISGTGGDFCGADLAGAEILPGVEPGGLRFTYIGEVDAPSEFLDRAIEMGAITNRAEYEKVLPLLNSVEDCARELSMAAMATGESTRRSD